MSTLEINRSTKVGELIENFPQMEQVLMEISPIFQKLKNPMLRRTVGKIASLEKVAEIGGIPPIQLVNQLRSVVGQPPIEVDDVESKMPVVTQNSHGLQGEPVEVIDGVAMLDRGEHPLGHIQQRMREIEKGQFLLLVTNFKPQPLIEAMEGQGFKVIYKVDEKDRSRHLTYIVK